MTWREFVQKVETELQAQGESDPEILYVDTGSWPDIEGIHVLIVEGSLIID